VPWRREIRSHSTNLALRHVVRHDTISRACTLHIVRESSDLQSLLACCYGSSNISRLFALIAVKPTMDLNRDEDCKNNCDRAVELTVPRDALTSATC
jgi:hypothetical protein